jgi:hypothetical protein
VKKQAYDRRYRKEHKQEDKRRYQDQREERLAYQRRYNKEHKRDRRVYQREYMRDYREGKRRRSQAEQPQPIQVFPEP